MRPSSSLLPTILALPLAAFLGCPLSGAAQMASPPPEQLVVEGVIQTASNQGTLRYVFIPVTVHGKPASALLDLGTTANLLSQETLSNLGVPLTGTLDSLNIGTAVERDVSMGGGGFGAEAPAGMPPSIGLIGTPILSHYDFLVDGPNLRVRLYRPQPGQSGGHKAVWFPPGITPADCMPMDPDPDGAQRVFLPLLVNGHAVHSMFDSGSDYTNINLAAAKVLGITKRTPGIHLLDPADAPQFSMYRGQKVWEVPGMTLTVGHRQIGPMLIHIYQNLPRESSPTDPELSLGVSGILHNILYISYSSGQVCLGDSGSR